MKKTQKYTQGQWQAIEARVYNRFTVFGEPSRQMICSCYVSGDYTPFAEQNANARLIASAPDLLSVALALVEFADGNNRINLTGKLAEAVGLARAAIAKAEGVQ